MNQDQTDQTREKILLVDDIPANLNVLRQALEAEGYDLLFATEGETALKVAARAIPDLILLDIIMPKMDGFEVCRQLKKNQSSQDIPVIFITAMRETEEVVEGFRVGGVDYIIKPFEKEEVLVRVETHLTNARLTKALRQRNRELQQEIARREQAEAARQTADERFSLISEQEAQRWGIAGFVGQSKTIGKILVEILKLQTTGTTSVLITGESGTGKELIARAIHFGGARAKGPFIPVNCSAIPSELSESLFFGHVKGAFTGANKDKKGYFELADGGTLFLDEIGDMPPGLQAKLLRVIEDGGVIPIGGTHEKHVDVRILAATNADLKTRMAEGAFRSDLYYRLAGFTVDVPPLRDRPEDIPLLASHFLSLFATEMGREKPALSSDALDALVAYPFPGNVRELKNIIERALIESGGEKIHLQHLHFVHRLDDTSSPAIMDKKMAAAQELPLNFEEAEMLLIQRALAQTDGNISEAARLLGINRSRIYRRLAKENIPSNVK
ncbi:sigma-54-dependent Fis family transcriptional regulator [bacterium]|nr:sigma-54-dependent Fis family transcriptional regulator [bacterium]